MYNVKKSNIHRIQVRLERDLLQGSFSESENGWRGYDGINRPGVGWREYKNSSQDFTVAPALLLCVFHSPLNKLRRLFIHRC